MIAAQVVCPALGCGNTRLQFHVSRPTLKYGSRKGRRRHYTGAVARQLPVCIAARQLADKARQLSRRPAAKPSSPLLPKQAVLAPSTTQLKLGLFLYSYVKFPFLCSYYWSGDWSGEDEGCVTDANFHPRLCWPDGVRWCNGVRWLSCCLQFFVWVFQWRGEWTAGSKQEQPANGFTSSLSSS